MNISTNNRYCNRFISHFERPIFSVPSQRWLCLQSRQRLGTRIRVSIRQRYTRDPPISPSCDPDRIFATRQLDALTVPWTHYVFNNCIFNSPTCFAGTNSIAIDLITMKDRFFSQHRPPAIRHFSNSCDPMWLHNDHSTGSRKYVA